MQSVVFWSHANQNNVVCLLACTLAEVSITVWKSHGYKYDLTNYNLTEVVGFRWFLKRLSPQNITHWDNSCRHRSSTTQVGTPICNSLRQSLAWMYSWFFIYCGGEVSNLNWCNCQWMALKSCKRLEWQAPCDWMVETHRHPKFLMAKVMYE